jgi:hypothetical protein
MKMKMRMRMRTKRGMKMRTPIIALVKTQQISTTKLRTAPGYRERVLDFLQQLDQCGIAHQTRRRSRKRKEKRENKGGKKRKGKEEGKRQRKKKVIHLG